MVVETMGLEKKIKEIADGIFTESGYVDIQELTFYPEIRSICEGNACRNYGKTWACPPGTGTLDECKTRVEQYDRMLLLSKKYDLKHSFDFRGMFKSMREFKKLIDELEANIKGELTEYQLLSNEGCERCEKCTYPDAPCRFPDKLHHSLEGYGLIVNELAKAAGTKYNNGENTVTFFGALLYKI